uniref:Uncharacterized protein n=1 Tax=Romanomermis culicivorax TaxID=13658 RepID=A0A915KD78_ROMCU
MARQAEIEATVGGSVKGHQTFEEERLMSPLKVIHRITETLEEIGQKLKPASKSNMVDMNYDEYYEDARAELYDDKYSR